jgi:hypothetical protein
MHMVIPSFSGWSSGFGAVGAVGASGAGAQAPIKGSSAIVKAKHSPPTTMNNLLPFIYTSLKV